MSDTSSATTGGGLHWLPQTRFGWRAVALLAVGVAFFIATTLAVGVGGQTGGANLWILFTIIPAGIAVVSGGAVAGYAIVRARERGALVALPLLIGLLVAWFVIGEILTPH